MKCGSVFSGAGLLDYGLTLAGFEHRWLCEWDAWRRELLAMRWPEATVYSDIRELDDLEPVDLIAGGFPCRGLSSAGKRQGFGHPETALWREQLRVIRLVRPRYVLVENVAALIGFHGGECFNEVLSGLAESGYECWWDVLPASAVGAPHRRERVFVVAYATGEHGEWAECEGSGRGRSEAKAGDDCGELASYSSANGCGSRGSNGVRTQPRPSPGPASCGTGEGGFDWGAYEPAIRRWEALTRPTPEPLVRRMDDGTPPRIHRSRLSALGDGVQVQVAELLGRMILQHAEEMAHLNAQEKVAA